MSYRFAFVCGQKLYFDEPLRSGSVSEVRSPYLVDWAITGRCNLSCRHCRGFPREELSPERARRLTGEIAALKPGWVIIEGGEPLLRSDLFELLSRLREGGLEVHLISNGMLITPEIVTRLEELGVRVMVSIDGATRETYEGVRGGASFEQVLDSARKYARAGLLEAINFTILRANYPEIPALFRLARSLGAPKINLIGLKPCADYAAELLSPREYEEAIRLTCRAAQETGVEFFFDEPFFWAVVKELGLSARLPSEGAGIVVAADSACAFGDYIFIEADGGVKPCSYASMVVASVRDRSLVGIWEEMQASPLLKRIKDPRSRTGACLDCGYLTECKGCRSRSFALSGDWFASDAVCPLRSRNKVTKEGTR
jgi:radical SAM protein with 4Fe4S-binding SPASM domain